MLVFVHGAGRSGRAAWPAIDRSDAVMLDLGDARSVDEQVAAVVSAAATAVVVVAHSHGAIPAVLAAPKLGNRLRGFVLVEPALYDVARGDPVIERHITAVEAARRAHETSGLAAYWRIVRPLMFGGEFDETRWAAEETLAARFQAVPSPWGFGLHATALAGIRTIVVTGGWNAEYEAIAAALVGAGAEHRVLPGAQHRPQDLNGFGSVLSDALRG